MYFAYGWPKVFSLDSTNSGIEQGEQFIFLHATEQFVFGVTSTAVHIWTSGLHRVHLSAARLEEEDVKTEGYNLAAFYCPAKATLAVVVSITLPIIIFL